MGKKCRWKAREASERGAPPTLSCHGKGGVPFQLKISGFLSFQRREWGMICHNNEMSEEQVL